MKLKSLVLAIILATCTIGLVLITNVQGNSRSSQAIAQTAGIQQSGLQTVDDNFFAALDDFFAALDDVSLVNEQANNLLINQEQYQQGLEIYQQELEQQVQILLGDVERNSLKIEQVAFALVKLATLSKKLGFLILSEQSLSSAETILRQDTDKLAIFSHTETRQEATSQENTSSSSTGFNWSFHWTSPRRITTSSVSLNPNAINPYVPHFNLLQQIYAAKSELAERQANPELKQEQDYNSLLASEVIRTLSIDSSIARQLSIFDSNDRLEKFAKAFSIRINAEDIRGVARTEDATIVSYSIISEQDNPLLIEREALRRHADSRGLTLPPSRRLSSPDKLFIWVVKPTGELTFKELQIPSNLVREIPGSSTLIGANQCEREVASNECRGQGGIAISQLVRITRSAIRVRVRGQQGTALSARLVRDGDNSTDHHASNSVVPQEQLNQQNEALKKLYSLLISPIENILPANEQSRVVFIPQGSLSFVPFAALKDSAGRYLIEKHTIQTAPNFRTLLLANLNRKKQSSNNKKVLIAGNPTMPNTPSLQLEDLPNAELEAEAINELFERNQYNPGLLIRGQATESRIRDQMRDARIIHLATHAILDAESETSRRPEGSVVLAPSGNDADENGFLTAAEIFQMKLEADLVVLSACNTGRGPLTPGGVVGLPFSLSIAGVPSEVVSLWAVPDDSTAQLMTKFYESYLASPNDKAQALRQAMLYMIRNGYSDSPLDWAAFTLVGTSN